MIEKYFEDYKNKYHEMKRALKTYIDAKSDFYTLTGINYDTMPKGNKKPIGLDDLLVNLEKLSNYYLKLQKEYEEIKERCKRDIDKLENPISRAIMEYAYLNFETNKKISCSLKEFHDRDYTVGYIKTLKAKAKEEFKDIITKYA